MKKDYITNDALLLNEADPIPYRPDSFPKVCGCGRVYDRAAWEQMRHAGIMAGELDGQRYFDDLEMRHCACKSTISVRLATVQVIV